MAKSEIAEKPLKPIEIARDLSPGLYHDGDGLYLQVSRWSTKSWLLRYMLAGASRKLGLGRFPTVGLADARKRASVARNSINQAIDPVEERKRRRDALRAARDAQKVERAKRMTFRQCAQAYIEAHAHTWRNAKHAAQWPATLETYVYPVIGDLPVADIDTALVLKVIEPIWKAKPETAGRVRGRVEKVLSWARARGLCSGENPARWQGHLDQTLPKKTKVRAVKHHAAMPYEDVAAFSADLRRSEFISARALEFTILTAVRTSEAINAKWSEVDEVAKVWTIPAMRMKSGREHQVPLPTRVLKILASLPKEGEFVFPGARGDRPLSNMAMLELLRGMKGPGLTVHGFRSSFRDWAGDQTGYPRDLIEFALAHKLKDETEAAYRRSTALEKRRKLMQAWTDYCAVQKAAGATSGKVMPIGKVRAVS